MKTAFIILSLIYSLLLGGCNSNMEIVSNARVFIQPADSYPVIFDISNMGEIKISQCNTALSFSETDILNRETDYQISVTKIINLSSKDKSAISDLITSLKSHKPNGIQIATDANIIVAVIDNEIYGSLYSSKFEDNADLLNLTYKLIELSPIRIGSEKNPLTPQLE